MHSAPSLEQGADPPTPVTPEQALVPGPQQEETSLPEYRQAVDGDTPAPASQTQTAPAESDDELLSTRQARLYLTTAQHALQEAMAPFSPAQAYILPAHFDRAIRALETIAQHIAILKTALDRTPALALTVKEHIGDMHHQLNIILDQIEHYLLPAFYQRFPGNFTQLQAALGKVERYFS